MPDLTFPLAGSARQTIKRVAMQALAERGLAKADGRFRDVWNMVSRGALFAFVRLIAAPPWIPPCVQRSHPSLICSVPFLPHRGTSSPVVSWACVTSLPSSRATSTCTSGRPLSSRGDDMPCTMDMLLGPRGAERGGGRRPLGGRVHERSSAACDSSSGSAAARCPPECRCEPAASSEPSCARRAGAQQPAA
jgi:hypothetical protein